MPEKLRIKEQHQELEQPKVPERLPDAEHAEPLRPGEKDPAQSLEEARETIEEIKDQESGPTPLEKMQQEEEKSKPMSYGEISGQLKKITLHRELKNIRRKLSAPDKALSKVVHLPVVKTVSEASSKTVARPSGLLGGGITAFVGSTGYLLLAKYMGFTYNYFLFVLLFVAGFGLGLIIELALSGLASKKQKA